MSYRDDQQQFERERYLETVGEVERLKREVARADAEIAELRRDAERYRVGHDRYETVRRMYPSKFSAIWTRSIATGERFDELVDAARGGE